MTPQDEVLDAATRRAAALAARDPAALTALLHPGFVWTTHRGRVMDREAYVVANTDGDLRWTGQRLERCSVAVVGAAAVLTAVVVDEVERAGAPQTFRLRTTQTWVRGEPGWQCLAGHAGPADADADAEDDADDGAGAPAGPGGARTAPGSAPPGR